MLYEIPCYIGPHYKGIQLYEVNNVPADDLVMLGTWGVFTNIPQALQNNPVKIYDTRNHIYSDNFVLTFCMCAQSMALGTRTKFQLEILMMSTISAMHKFWKKILESLWNVSETPPRYQQKQV